MQENQNNVINQNEIRITGLSRSGNHALINWILAQIKNLRFCFLNCAEPKQNPFTSARPLGKGKSGIYTNISGFSNSKEEEGDFQKKDYLVYSYEDTFLGPLMHRSFKKQRQKWLGDSLHRKDILLIRDPFNLFASRIKAGFLLADKSHRQEQISWKVLKRIYKQHAREFLGEKKYLGNSVKINYNKWVANKQYRQSISEQLEIPFSDEGLFELSRVAGGSSFEGTSISAENLHKKIENRWKNYMDNEQFWELFDEELAELSFQIFGETKAFQFYQKMFQ